MIEVLFFLTGAIIFLGFFSMLFFERTRIPDVLILMSVGMILRSSFFFVDPQVFISLAPYVGAIALIMILFDGGLDFNFFKVVCELYEATRFTVLVFLLTCLTVMMFLHLLFEWNMLNALLLGAVIGGTSSAIVVPVINNLSLEDKPKIILSLESALTDALCIIVAIAVIQIILSGSPNVRDAVNSLIGAFSIATFLAFIFGLIWMSILKKFYGRNFGYLLTIGVILILYAVVEFSRGNGGIAVLVFGLMLGNSSEIAKLFRMTGDFSLDQSIKAFHTEVSFFVRTFFFVYLGMIFNPKALSSNALKVSVVVLLAILLSRYIIVRLLVSKDKSMEKYRLMLLTMLPRGLAAAVLASVPLNAGIMIESFQDIVVLIIILTNIIATVGAFAHEREIKKLRETADKNRTPLI